MSFFTTVLLVLIFGAAVIAFGPVGWRTRIFHAVTIAVPGIGAILQQLQVVDWSKLIDVPKVAYGLAVGIPLVGSWLREITTGPAGDK